MLSSQRIIFGGLIFKSPRIGYKAAMMGALPMLGDWCVITTTERTNSIGSFFERLIKTVEIEIHDREKRQSDWNYQGLMNYHALHKQGFTFLSTITEQSMTRMTSNKIVSAIARVYKSTTLGMQAK